MCINNPSIIIIIIILMLVLNNDKCNFFMGLGEIVTQVMNLSSTFKSFFFLFVLVLYIVVLSAFKA